LGISLLPARFAQKGQKVGKKRGKNGQN